MVQMPSHDLIVWVIGHHQSISAAVRISPRTTYVAPPSGASSGVLRKDRLRELAEALDRGEGLR